MAKQLLSIRGKLTRKCEVFDFFPYHHDILRTASPSAAVSNRTVALRSARQPRLSYSSFAPSSEHDHPKNLKSDATEENPPQREEDKEAEEEKRTWNLRPRKACVGGASEVKNQKPSRVTEPPPKSSRQRGIAAESPGVEVKNENHRLWVALSRDEIEEDVFSMSGNKPSRRPRKRAKTLQKHLDVMFPGLCLVGMNADCFIVSTSPAK
ncbi:PREDICTED: uncharacterized protein LOC106332660 [Brassica oleracea var. oleracea]|uniref:uncharacterized protein LOC106332660 n=1 Tax=Brassica oleracea var. oleracea TaxID=109376 RepID=UPI0006A722BD|nr:PREDICTED: uncharacterized protein LOC106332660 [Brassica oleracea var. oleracea]